ncbi:MAG: cytochrome c oxidase subunit II [Verrucomicrobia bacterium]|nr:cytochrome c oxidase subunit II [Verrucomicrobiota bacterium]
MEKLLQLPVLASEHGQRVNNLMVYIHWLMISLFVGWLVYFLYALWRFNQKRNRRGDYLGVRNHASSYLEVLVAGIEGVLLVFVAVPVWARQVDKFPKESESTVIQVVAQQFAWNARYPGLDGVFGKQDMSLVNSTNTFGVDPADLKGRDDVQVLNEMHVPVNKPVIAYISSKDVIHSFKLLAMRVTQDAIPGMRVPIWFKPVKEGKYQIYCAQLCGNGHANMAGGVVVVQSQAAYDKWLASKIGAATSFE